MSTTRKILLTILIVLLCVGGIGGGLVSIADNATAGDLLYPLDRAIEDIQMSMTDDPAEQAELELEFLDERVEELEEVSEEGDEENLEEAIDEVEKAYGNAFGKTEEMIQAYVDGNVSEVVHERVLRKQEENTIRHEEKLQEVKSKVAEEKLNKVMEKNKEAKKQAKEALGEEE